MGEFDPVAVAAWLKQFPDMEKEIDLTPEQWGAVLQARKQQERPDIQSLLKPPVAPPGANENPAWQERQQELGEAGGDFLSALDTALTLSTGLGVGAGAYKGGKALLGLMRKSPKLAPAVGAAGGSILGHPFTGWGAGKAVERLLSTESGAANAPKTISTSLGDLSEEQLAKILGGGARAPIKVAPGPVNTDPVSIADAARSIRVPRRVTNTPAAPKTRAPIDYTTPKFNYGAKEALNPEQDATALRKFMLSMDDKDPKFQYLAKVLDKMESGRAPTWIEQQAIRKAKLRSPK